MRIFKKLTPFLMAASLFISSFAMAEDKNEEEAIRLEEVVVTAPPMVEPLTVMTDPKNPRQPVPTADGAGYLKNIPGFCVTRKGGHGGDPVLRGLGGSRLNIMLDGENILGGCGGRMDPPTAYIYPESYGRITILKGPQTVLYGGGNVSGIALFERKTRKFEMAGIRGIASAMGGSFGRNDQMIDLTGGISKGFLRIVGTRSHADNYKDGSGHDVRSFYTRRSLSGIMGWTPDDTTRLEFSSDVSDAEAAYADRSMDGAKFDRNGYGLKFEKTNITSLLNKVEAGAYHNYIDHVMDNFSLRKLNGMAMLNNPDRTTMGGRLAAKLLPSQTTITTIGVDYKEDKRTSRSGTTYASKPRDPDMTFKNLGIFCEVEQELEPENRIIAGLRMDSLNVKNEKTTGTDAGKSDNNTAYGAFARYEHNAVSAPATVYLGIGLAERPADWWERNRVFYLKAERNTQIDTGVIYNSDNVKASLSLFYAKINDFILISSAAPTARNINATTYGSEADASYLLAENWTARATLAYVRGDNDSDNKPLAQMPPLEGTLGLQFDNKTFSTGVLLRAVAAQDRFDAGKGSIFGTDIGETPGFQVLSINAGYRPAKNLLITAGADNLLDATYAEHISKGVDPTVGALGYEKTTRINEPGRNFWIKANYSF